MTTTGTVPDTHVKSISLVIGTTTVATATSPTQQDTWTLEPDPATAWIGPTDATNVSLEATLDADAQGGETLALEIPPVNDTDGDGAFDPGDAGLFFEQGDPRGGFGPGTTLTVPQDTSGNSNEPSPLQVDVSLPAANISTATDTFSVPITGSEADRAVRGELVNAVTGAVVQTRTATLDETGSATLDFATEPGRYVIRAAAVEGDGATESANFTIETAASVDIRPQSTHIRRGTDTTVDLTLRGVESGHLDLQAPNGTVIDSLVFETNTSVPESLTFATDGLPDGTANRSPSGNRTAANPPQWIGAEYSGSAGNATKGQASTPSERAQTEDTADGTKAGDRPVPTNTTRSATRTHSSTPLAAGRYTMVLSTPDGHRSTATVRVMAEWAADFETMVVPQGVAVTDGADVRNHATERTEIAAGDRLVIEISTNGFGNTTQNIAAGGPPAHANASQTATDAAPPHSAANNTANEGTGRPNASKSVPGYVALKSPGRETPPGSKTGPQIDRVEHPTSNRFYVVADARGEEIEPGMELAPSLVLTDASPLIPANATNRTKQATAGSGVAVVPATASFDDVSKNGSLDLAADESVTIQGSTTVAPGTHAVVRIEGENDSFVEEEPVTIEDDGTYETTTDLSEYDGGTTYTVSLSANGERLSPLRSGSFRGDDRSGGAAAAGGGGGTGSVWSGEDTATTASPVVTTAESEQSPTTAADSFPTPVDTLPLEAMRDVWSAVPKPVRFGRTELLLIALGGVALLSVGLGIRRLGGP